VRASSVVSWVREKVEGGGWRVDGGPRRRGAGGGRVEEVRVKD
jgi:hypothetical protein